MSRWLERRKERRKYRKEVLRELGTITLPRGEAERGIRPKSEKVFAHDHRTWLKQRCNWTKGSKTENVFCCVEPLARHDNLALEGSEVERETKDCHFDLMRCEGRANHPPVE